MMTLDEVLNQWIPYRLQAIETLQFAWDWVGESEQPRQVDIVVDGKLKLRGNVALIANPMIEIGLVHARALLEFLGLAISKDGKLTQVRRRRPDDIAIEAYGTDAVRIAIITPSEALSAYPGPKEEAETALAAIFEWTNKGVAHSTTGELSTHYTDRRLDIACRGIRALLNNHLYAKLERDIPAPPSANVS